MKPLTMERPKTVRPPAPASDEPVDELDVAEPAVVTARPRTKGRARRDPVDLAWHLLTSVRVAFFLIGILTVATLTGTLLIQAPAEIVADSDSYRQWLERIRPQFGALTDVLSVLGLFDIFHSVWFRSTTALLGLSIVVCSLNRWPGVRHNLTSPRVRVGPGFFRVAPFRAAVAAPAGGLEPAAAATLAGLRDRGFRVLQEEDGNVRHFYADRYRFSQLGTFSLHVGMVLFLTGAVWGAVAGVRERAFTIPEGSVRAVGMGSDLSVKLEAFADEYYPDGPPSDYRSDLVLYKGATEVRRQTIRVNEPLEYDGWRFHQGFFGPAAILEVRDSSGRVLYNDGVALAWRAPGDRAMGSFRVPEYNLTVYLVGPASGGVDPMIAAGELRVELYRGNDERPILMENIQQGKPKTIAGLSFTFLRERQFSGLQVVNNPAEPLVYLTWVMMGLGLTVTFYFPYRRMWARCQQEADGSVRILLGASGRRDIGLSREVAGVEAAIHARIGTASRRQHHA